MRRENVESSIYVAPVSPRGVRCDLREQLTHDFDVVEAGHHEILEDLTADTSGTDDQNFAFQYRILQFFAKNAANTRGHLCRDICFVR